MKTRLFAVLACALVIGTPLLASASGNGPGVDPDQALQQLEAGNARWAAGASTFPHADQARRTQTSEQGQHPFATIIACSDSRVPVELLFDQGIGDLFVIRVAGNVCDTDEIGSIEYGVDHLGTPVMLVLGHTGCGAVQAVSTRAEVHGSIPALVDNIVPALARAHAANPGKNGNEIAPLVVRENVWQSIEDLLENSHAVRERAANGQVKIVGAVYDLGTGSIEWMGEHPGLRTLLVEPAGHIGK